VCGGAFSLVLGPHAGKPGRVAMDRAGAHLRVDVRSIFCEWRFLVDLAAGILLQLVWSLARGRSRGNVAAVAVLHHFWCKHGCCLYTAIDCAQDYFRQCVCAWPVWFAAMELAVAPFPGRAVFAQPRGAALDAHPDSSSCWAVF